MGSPLRSLARAGVNQMLHTLRRIGGVRYAMDQMVLTELLERSRSASGHARWIQLDSVYSRCRRQLRETSGWRYGPDRVHDVIVDVIAALESAAQIDAAVYCDLGCGRYHPLGNSAILFLNGAARTIALDIQVAEEERGAEALADLLCDCMSNPDRWHLTEISREDFLSRIRQFDLSALQRGLLKEGVAGTPLEHVVTDIHAPELELGQIQLMSSRAVLEHFQDLPLAARRLYEMMSPGGVAFHHVDVTDHRSHVQPDRYHAWSFLAEADDWTDGLVNRLRPSEIRQCFEEAGFRVLKYDIRRGDLPDGFRQQMTGRFRQMDEADQCATGVDVFVQRPEDH